jgi:hypothetical protein
MSNSLLNGYQSATVGLDAVGVPAGYGVGMADAAQSGPYSSILGTTDGPTRFSADQAALAPVAPGTANARYFALGGVLPVITGFSPQTVNTGDTVRIFGVNFSAVSAVGLGGIPTPFTIVSPTEIRAVAGAGASGVLSLVSTFGVASSTSTITFANAPAISSISPNYGTTGATARIVGERLQALTEVRFGGVLARSFAAQSATQATAIVDSGATGAVQVVTPNGAASLPNAFTFYRTPSITDFTPRVARAGDTVRITGAHFDGLQAVRFGVVPAASFTLVASGLITAVVPPNAATSRIVVENLVGRDSVVALPELTVIAPPSILSVTPLALGLNQNFTVVGAEFHPNAVVRIGSTTAASVEQISLGLMHFSFNQAMTGVLTISASGGTVSFAAPLTVLAPPTITSFAPQTPTPGQTVTVQGTNFAPQGTLVSVGGVPVQATVNSSTQITISLPPNASGVITIATPGGAVSSATAVNPLRAPIISGVQPPSGRAGSVVEIRGAYLFPTQSVSFGGAPASFTMDTARGLVRAIVPSGVPTSAQTGDSAVSVSLATPGGITFAPFDFTILPPLSGAVITGFEPQSLREGDTLRIFGVNIPTTATVRLAGVIVTGATIERGGALALLVVPRGVVPDTAFTVEALLQIDDGAFSTSAALRVAITGGGNPVIRSFSPSEGAAETSVVITGENFGVAPRGEILAVRIGGVQARSFTVLSPTQILVSLGECFDGKHKRANPRGYYSLGVAVPF